MFRALIASLFRLKKPINMFERMEITESIYEGVVTPSYKKLLGQKTTILESLGKL